jgi:hypothetical protein
MNFGKALKLFKLITSRKEMTHLFNLRDHGYLASKGYFTSLHQRRPLDAAGKPLPWLSYPFIDFIGPRLRDNQAVLEFGSGNSTLYFASRVGTVCSVEHDRAWYEVISRSMPGNVAINLVPLDVATGNQAYIAAGASFGRKFDLVLIDGRERVETMMQAVGLLNDGGVIVLDNADREKYATGVKFLHGRGFRSIHFVGMCPGGYRSACTQLFYRPCNCLDV